MTTILSRKRRQPVQIEVPRAGLRGATVSAVALFAMLAAVAPVSGADGPTELTIEISGFESRAGRVAIAVFDSPDRFDARESPVARAFVPIGGDSVVWTASIEPAGERVAVLAYHDVNGNGRIDFGRMGIPQEPYGFSNGARRLFGPPDFATASLAVGDPGPVEIRLR